MRVLEDGSYLLSDGTVVPADEVGKKYLSSPKKEKAEEPEDKLQEGQCSGRVLLED